VRNVICGRQGPPVMALNPDKVGYPETLQQNATRLHKHHFKCIRKWCILSLQFGSKL